MLQVTEVEVAGRRFLCIGFYSGFAQREIQRIYIFISSRRGYQFTSGIVKFCGVQRIAGFFILNVYIISCFFSSFCLCYFVGGDFLVIWDEIAFFVFFVFQFFYSVLVFFIVFVTFFFICYCFYVLVCVLLVFVYCCVSFRRVQMRILVGFLLRFRGCFLYMFRLLVRLFGKRV